MREGKVCIAACGGDRPGGAAHRTPRSICAKKKVQEVSR